MIIKINSFKDPKNKHGKILVKQLAVPQKNKAVNAIISVSEIINVVLNLLSVNDLITLF